MLKIIGLSGFQDAINKMVKKVYDSPVQIAKMIMLEINRNTVLKTPVEFGFLVGRWNISTTNKPTFSYTKTGTKSTTIERNNKKIDRFKGGILWFANNMDYAEPQEFGTNKLSGNFMLTKGIQSAKARAYKIAKEGF